MSVGQTIQTLKVRMAEHKVAVCNGNMDYAITRHSKEETGLHETLDLSPFFYHINDCSSLLGLQSSSSCLFLCVIWSNR